MKRPFVHLSLIPGFAVASALATPLCFADALTLQNAIEIAQSKSPDIRQLQEQYDSSAAKKRLALAPSEPTLLISDNDLTQQFHLGTAATNVFQLTQPVGFPGRAVLTHAQLSDQSDAASYQLRAMKLQVAANVKAAYYALQLAQKNIQLNADTKLAYERILEIAKRKYETGTTAQVDYLNAQVALLSNQNDLADLQTAERTARAQLNVYLKNAVDAPIEVEPIKMAYKPKIDIEDAVARMLGGRNEIKAAQSQEKAMNRAYDLAWMSILPDFQFIFGVNFYRQASASPYSGDFVDYNTTNYGSWPSHTYSVGVQLTIPLWFMFNEREVIVGAAHDRGAAEANLDIVLNQSKVALENAVDTIHSTGEKIENFEKHILPLSEQSLKLAMVDYGSGKINFQTLADTATARRQARQSYAAAVVTYLTNYATYGQLIGEDL
ncbi:MAG: TolC family protein [Oligoflexia bacterium]|nr:TolC family protein [Oligoflexia bacterium]